MGTAGGPRQRDLPLERLDAEISALVAAILLAIVKQTANAWSRDAESERESAGSKGNSIGPFRRRSTCSLNSLRMAFSE